MELSVVNETSITHTHPKSQGTSSKREQNDFKNQIFRRTKAKQCLQDITGLTYSPVAVVAYTK